MQSAMSMGTRYRVTGRLMRAKRGLMIEGDDGGVYVLDADPDAHDLLGHRVIIEGVRNGFDRLDVEWIGRAGQGAAAER
jgi:hypothetical protein